MPRRMRISRAGIELIKSFEGFTPRTTPIGDDRWVIGYGHVRKDRDQYRVSREEAEQILKEYDLPPFEQLVLDHTFTPLHQGAFDALVSFAFNVGKEAFLSSEVLSLINMGETLAAADAMGAWRKAKIEGRTIVVDALVRRRAAEKALFLSDPVGPAPAPSAIIRPQLDPAVQYQSTRDRSVVVEAPENNLPRALPRDEGSERRQAQETVIAAPRQMERLTRRFNEALAEEERADTAPTGNPEPSPAVIDPKSGPTPEEITAAISELVNGSDHTEEPSFQEDAPGIDLEAGDFDDDVEDDELEPYPGLDLASEEPRQSQERFERTLGESADVIQLPEIDEPLVIDDLETVEVSEEDIQAAMRRNAEIEGTSLMARARNWEPFAALATLGAVLFTWGMFALSSGEPDAPAKILSLDVFLAVTGAILFVTMAYYFLREFVKPENS